MTVHADKFTPEILLSAPRRSAGIPNRTGKKILHTVSTYSFQSHSKTNEIKVLDSESGQSSLFLTDKDAHDPGWLDDKRILWLQGGENGVTKLMVGDTEKVESGQYSLGTIDGPLSNLKLKALDDKIIAIAVTGDATPSGGLYNPEKDKKKPSTAKVYTSLFVRHWDTYVTPNRSSIWYGALSLSDGKYELLAPGLTNALKGSGLESPIAPFGGTDHFDIGCCGLTFVAKDPNLNQANTTTCDAYFLPLKTFTEKHPALPKKLSFPGLDGAATSPVFSPDGRSIAYLKMKDSKYESDRNRLLVIPDLLDLNVSIEGCYNVFSDESWTLSPSSVIWSADGALLFLVAEDTGRAKLFSIPSTPPELHKLPEVLTKDGNISSVTPITKDLVFLSSTSLVDNSLYSMLNLATSDPFQIVVSSNSRNGMRFGISPSMVGEEWFYSRNGYPVHALTMVPSKFDKKKKYPLCLLIHGGPQGAWGDSWSTRWNPAIFAEQGYVVVMPNPTGSTGYGQDFVDGITNEWGGRPYNDIEDVFDQIKKNWDWVDIDRSVALGASYGGYMMNWIQGHPLGKELKAIVTHDGVFCTLNQYSSEEIYFPEHDFGGTIWSEARKTYEKWDPSKFTANWSTPNLIIHSENDYRLPIGEGLAPFNILQARGIESRFLTFPDENHWVLKPENSLVWHKEVLNWINKYVGLPQYGSTSEYVCSLPPPGKRRESNIVRTLDTMRL